MVTVGDIERINGSKLVRYSLDCFGAVDYPYCVLYALGDKVIDGSVSRFPILNSLADELVGAVCKEDRTRVCVAVINVVDSVGFLVCSCELVLLDNVVDVVVDCGAADKTGLKDEKGIGQATSRKLHCDFERFKNSG